MSNELFGEVVKTISLDFAQKTSPVTVFAKQGDNRTRIIHIQPLMNGVPMNIDTSFQYVAKFAAKKPDGHYVYNDSAKINDDGTITVTLTDQTLAAHGNAICCIVLETQSGDVLSSQNFTLIVEFSAGAYQNLASSDEIMGLDDKLAQVQELIDKLGEEIQRIPPINPEDKDKVLTANEDGTAGWKDPKGGSGENGGGTTIHYYNSLGEVPADLPEGSFVAVPSEDTDADVVKVINLNDYESGQESLSELGAFIASSIMTANGLAKLNIPTDTVAAVFANVDNDQPLLLRFSLQNSGITMNFETTQITKAYGGDTLTQVIMSGAAFNTDIVHFTVVFINTGSILVDVTHTSVS